MFSLIAAALLSMIGFRDDDDKDNQPSYREKPTLKYDDIIDVEFEEVND